MPNILIVEDDTVISESLKKALSRKGLDVLATDNGIEAVSLIKDNKFDVLLLDINLPGISGLKVLEEIKKLSPDLKVIVITGTFDSETEKQARDYGAYSFLKKPFMIEVLFKLLTDLNIIT